MWRMTKARVDIQNNASMGVEATQQLEEFGRAFRQRMEEVSRGIDLNAVESRSFKAAFEQRGPPTLFFTLSFADLQNPKLQDHLINN